MRNTLNGTGTVNCWGPGDAIIGDLFCDLGGPFFIYSGDLRAPVKALIVELSDLFHAIGPRGNPSNWVH